MANLHAHTAETNLKDDGVETPLQLHRALRSNGFDFSLHSIHSVFNPRMTSSALQEGFEAQRAAESQLHIPGLTVAVGEELTVAGGPNFSAHDTLLGYSVPGNLNHVTILGTSDFIPNGTALKTACDRAHKKGGVCLVNHPGPGPSRWEPGLWETVENRAVIDGLEIYNGVGVTTVGFISEDRYLEATSYTGLGCKIAAIASPDTHGPHQVEQIRKRVAGTIPGRLMGLFKTPIDLPRPELAAMTWLQTTPSSETAVIAAIKARRTVAVFGMPNLHLAMPGIGEIRHEKSVHVSLRLSRPVARVELYKNGRSIQTWKDADAAEWSEETSERAAYVFGAQDGAYGHLMTSALWYEPQ